MAITPLRALLFVVGLLIAGTATAYYVGAFDPSGREEARRPDASAPDGQASATDSGNAGQQAKGARPQASAAADASAAAQGEGAAGEEEEKVVVPAFDLLRAEPDGSLVVAGHAAPGAEVQILSGSSVLTTTTAGPDGDFAAVLDEPLDPGEYNIVLRATSSDKVSATSLETAIVSIPTDENGQLVALVQQPGVPSRLISAPSPLDREDSGGDRDAAPSKGGAVAPDDAPAQEVARAEERPLPSDGGQDGGQKAASSEPAAGESPEPGQGTVDEAPAAVAEAPAAGPTAPAADELRPGADEETAEAAPEEGSAEAPQVAQKPAPSPDSPFIEAVEIDGRQIFVAGRAEPGRLLRVYANDTLLGQTTVTPEGRFLIEAERDLPVGDYIIRADVLDSDGATVIARAAVPFERQTGEKIAAVAPETLGHAPAGEERAVGEAAVSPEAPAAADAPDLQGKADAASESGAGGTGNTVAPPAGSVTQPETSVAGAPHTAPEERQETVASGTVAPSSVPGKGIVPETVSPALEQVDGAVIIRRGDTLWHISRRVYGRGIRYTTIYLANQDQIRDPDLIWPGQIFTVPEETREGEKANLRAIGEQALTPEEMAAQKVPGR